MFKYVAIITLTFCSQAYAGWTATPLVSGHDGTYYWDTDTVKYSGTHLKIWIADDYGEAQISKMKPATKYLSIKEKLDIDCAHSRSRVINYFELSDHFGSGTTVFQEKHKAKWIAITPDSLSQSVMTTFCKKPA
jgi:hypothetical protein